MRAEMHRVLLLVHPEVLQPEARRSLRVVRQGRQRFNYLNAVPIRRIYERWVSRYEGHWSAALIALKEDLERPHPREPRSVSRPRRPGRKAPRLSREPKP